jgi:membrane-associated phospholipid phosphatase
MKFRILINLTLILPLMAHSQNLDIRMLRAINSSKSLTSDGLFRFASNSEIYFVIGVPLAIGATGLIRDDKNQFHDACVIVAGEVITKLITQGFKYSVNRDRPFVTYPDITQKIGASDPSFPSGHTSSAFATATSLSLAYPKWYVIAPSYLWAGSVGYSRMHLGVHYPSDVLAGALIGSGSAFLSYKINQKLVAKRKHKPCDCP